MDTLQNVVFIYGENSYLAHKALIAIKNKYLQKNINDYSLLDLESEQIKPDELISNLQSAPLFTQKRLVIVRNIFTQKNTEVLERLKEICADIPSSTLFIIFENGQPDKRLKEYKWIINSAIAKYQPKLDNVILSKWIQTQTEKFDANISSEAITQLIDRTQGDMWMLENEINKLTNFSNNISISDVALLTPETENLVIFALNDSIFKQNVIACLKILDRLRVKGENDLYILAMIASALRSLALVMLAKKNNYSNPAQIASYTKLHPFVISKNLAFASKINFQKIIDYYRNLVAIDVAIKTGKIDSGAGLDLLMYKLCL